ncbi:alkyl hydroperoxide reductase subunit F [Enterococcus malodoratus]|uniref:Alkyl hydroperoxide reductase, F subunit n=1 Tax=Enterococcus malodoratus ATCC 43197 TaxID=1158601 RepID=R2R1E2_9ENTE|nr:alkyl hydroperoxide reductase subunit F [Enterococcus malodoratus]EOH77475.1 alkyl hydroperoxide reductase, F subunit [Enterococcus malodoratus ATCC 43197]EOT64111.1 alkyl hydroperoxide reductase, F subunit [Enterococcus malodoratus ATCC 43197]OJG61184.1 alkyl hydroperoxide reductase, F subunit [Enterococcus malodoratus]SPX00885.1 alkyl hydroperoxide reductase, F subunit [Enterococcus malodoratus]STD66167.1 alkyl hydroperoxide reductase, F subunit [Enterococcus malodoratus]
MLDNETKEQLKQYLALLESDIVFSASLDESDDSKKIEDFLTEVAEMDGKISIEAKKLKRTPSFEINQKGSEASGIIFAGLPMGHEFTSFILALLQVGGRAPKIEDSMIQQIQSIDRALIFETYVSLTCHNCPDVVQALNIMAVLNPKISHTMIEGGMYQAEIDEKEIMAVPTVFLNDEEFDSGRMTIEQIIEKVSGPLSADEFVDKETFDVLVIGGGPAGASSAIYAARKGIKTGMVVETFGGQVLETLGIENVIGTPYVEGPQLMRQVEEHVKQYDVDIMKGQRAKSIQKNDLIEVELENGAQLKAKTAILSTGARWRAINVPGEKEFKNKGIAYCPHCDGPLFKDKEVVVIGGGNSGIEAAIDLAGLAKHIYVLEFLPELKADQVLQEKLYSLSNVTVITNAATKEITGSSHVEALTYTDRLTNEEHTLNVEGVFILIGLMPNTEWLSDTVNLTDRGEILVDKHGATNVEGIFAAGDCTDSAYKQIIISMGSGATAALGAFDYLIRQT